MRAAIQSCTVGGHPVSHSQAGSSTQQHPWVPTSQGEGTPEQCQELHIPPRLSQQTGQAPLTAQGLDDTRPGRCWALPLPSQTPRPCSPGGAWPRCRILLRSSCNGAQQDCIPGVPAAGIGMRCTSLLQARHELDQHCANTWRCSTI